jgi:hypothetical protein
MIVRILLVTDFGEIDITNDEHILRNLNWTNPRIRVDYA